MKRIILVLMFSLMLVVSLFPASFAQNDNNPAAGLNAMDKRAIQEHKELRNQYVSAKSTYASAKQAWLSARNSWRDSNTQASTDRAIGAAKTFLLRSADVLVRQLEVLKSKVEDNDQIYNQEQILEDIDALLTEIRSDIVPAIESAETREDITAAKEDLLAVSKKVKTLLKPSAGYIINRKIEYSIEKMDSLIETLDEKILDLESQSYDVAEIQEMLTEAEEHVAEAKQKHEMAREKFSGISTENEANKKFREGHEYVVQAGKHLRDAHQKLQRVVREMRLLLNAHDDDDDDDDDLDDSDDDSDEEDEEELIVCDHNGDGDRDLSDLAIFTANKDDFDVDGNGEHDLSDVSIYAQNADDDEWCLSVQDQFVYGGDDDVGDNETDDNETDDSSGEDKYPEMDDDEGEQE